jgi:hypothetical protein
MSDAIELQATIETLREELREKNERLSEYERSKTERPTSRSGVLLEVMSELEETRRAVGNLSSSVETSGRMATECTRVISCDLPHIVARAVSEAVANTVIELTTRLQQGAAKIEDLEMWRRRSERECYGCELRRAAGE